MKKYERHADWHNDFDRRVAERKERQRRRRRRDRIIGAISLVVLATMGTVAFLNVGEGGEGRGPSRSETPTVAAPPSPASSAYDPDVVAEGLARAVAQVIATEPNSNVGLPRIQEILTNTAFVTGCVHRNYDVQTAPTRRAARALDTGRGFQVIAKVLYALPDWDDQYVSVTVSVRCP